MHAVSADLCQCLDCLRNLKPYELDENGLCAICDQLAQHAERLLPPPPWPTGHEPGTEGKLIALEWRARNGFSLWHPDDAQGHAPIASNAHSSTYTVREPRAYRMAVAG